MACAAKVTPEGSPYLWALIEFNVIPMSRAVNWAQAIALSVITVPPKLLSTLKRSRSGRCPPGLGDLVVTPPGSEVVSLASKNRAWEHRELL